MIVYPEHPPNTLIIPGEDLVADFMSHTGGRVKHADLKEIMTQIVQGLLNEENGDVEFLTSLPDFNRMTDPAFASDPDYRERVQSATLDLGSALHQRLMEVGAYIDNTFSYFFDDFLGYDFIFRNLPY